MGKNRGLCSICGKGGKLSFEHIPPEAAYNEKNVTLYKFNDWMEKGPDGQMTGGSPQPKGTGLISICKSCNEKTGGWYVPEFAKLISAGIQLHSELEKLYGGEDPDKTVMQKVVQVMIKEIRPLPVLKQIVTMLLGVNGPGFGRKNPSLVEFVLSPESRGLPARYRISLSLFLGPMARFVGLAAAVDLTSGAIRMLTEVAYPPFAYLMTIDAVPELPVGEITRWADAESNETRDVALDLFVGLGNTPYPGDYRSRAAIDAEVARNRAALESGSIDGTN